MTAPIAVQLYNVRKELAQDFDSVIERIAATGYAGVEPAYHHLGASPNHAALRFNELDLKVPSAHVPLPLGEEKNKVLDFMSTMNSMRIVSGKGPDQFATLEEIRRTCDLFNEAQAVAAENDMSFIIHNHWWEFEVVEGRYVYQVMLERLDPAISFEIDVYWVQVAALDPAQIVSDFGPLASLLHIKDGPAVRGEPMVAVGDGVLDIPGIIRAGQDHTEWLIVELDECATDMQDAVEKSYRYLADEGFGHGR